MTKWGAVKKYRAAHPERVKESARRAYHERVRTETPEEKRSRIEQKTIYLRGWKKMNPDKVKKSRDKIDKDKRRTYELKRNFGITRSAYDDLLRGQGNKCAVCRGIEWGGHGPSVDHDHERGFVRGILCHRCNLAIGLIRDDPRIAELMAGYLRERSMKCLG
jgi:hypothetical protein